MAEPLSARRSHPRSTSRPRRQWLTPQDASLELCASTAGPGVVVVSAEGEIDLANRAALAAALAPAAADPVTRLLICDLSGTAFLACSGLSVLLEIKSELDSRGARLRVVASDPTVLRVLAVTGQHEVLDVRADLDEALADGIDPPAVAAGMADPPELTQLRTALDHAVEQAIELAAACGRLAEQVSALDAASLADRRGAHWKPHETLADMARDLRVLQNHLATGALLAAPAVEDLGHLHATRPERTRAHPVPAAESG